MGRILVGDVVNTEHGIVAANDRITLQHVLYMLLFIMYNLGQVLRKLKSLTSNKSQHWGREPIDPRTPNLSGLDNYLVHQISTPKNT